VPFLEKWMKLEIIKLSEISQAKKTNITCHWLFAEPRPKMMMMTITTTIIITTIKWGCLKGDK
jgi:hypothetical protein